MDLALRAGEVKRVDGKIVGLSNKGKAAVRAAKFKSAKARQERIDKRQRTALAKLQGIGGRKAKRR